VNKLSALIQNRRSAEDLTLLIATYSKLLASFCAID
jgi:hypothetical protein